MARVIALREEYPDDFIEEAENPSLDDSLSLPIEEFIEGEGSEGLEYPVIDDGFGEEDLVPEEVSAAVVDMIESQEESPGGDEHGEEATIEEIVVDSFDEEPEKDSDAKIGIDELPSVAPSWTTARRSEVAAEDISLVEVGAPDESVREEPFIDEPEELEQLDSADFEAGTLELGDLEGQIDEALEAMHPEGGPADVELPVPEATLPRAGPHGGEAGLSLLSGAFEGCRAAWPFEKGALLLRQGGYFMPWLIAGFDQRSARALRMPEEEATALAGEDRLDDSAIAKLEPYFSVRDFASLEGLSLRAFRSGGELAAIILAEDAGDADLGADCGPEDAIAAAALRIGNLLAGEEGAGDLKRSAASLAARPGKLLAALLDPGAAIAALAAASPSLDPFRVSLLVARLLDASLSASSGACARTPSGKVAIAVHGPRGVDPEMLLHRIKALLSGFLPGATLPLLRLERIGEFESTPEGLAGLLGSFTGPAAG